MDGVSELSTAEVEQTGIMTVMGNMSIRGKAGSKRKE